MNVNFVHKLSHRHNFQLIIILLVIASFGLIIKNNSYLNTKKPIDYLDTCLSFEGNLKNYKFVSSQCNCVKDIPVPENMDINATLNYQFHWCSEDSSIRGPSQKIVTYALFGNTSHEAVYWRYFSLLRNISVTADRQYSGWTVRIYHDILERDELAHHLLCKVYCRYQNVDLCSVPLLADRIGNETSPIDPTLLRGLNPRMLRYLVMLDPNVDLFISRDVGSVIWQREVDAVDEWLKSNYTFHLMRDHPGYSGIILAGMFGVKVAQRRDLVQGLAKSIILSGQNRVRGQEQTSLDHILWPFARMDVMAHDSYHCNEEHITRTTNVKIFPFPTKRNGSYYVGSGAGQTITPSICPEACRPPDHKDWQYC